MLHIRYIICCHCIKKWPLVNNINYAKSKFSAIPFLHANNFMK